MKFKLQLHVLTDDNAIECTEDIVTFDKDYDQLADLGLNLAESKQLLAELQRQFVGQQTGAYLNDHRYCRHCGKKRAINDYSPVNFRSLFGTVVLRSPRLIKKSSCSLTAVRRNGRSCPGPRGLSR